MARALSFAVPVSKLVKRADVGYARGKLLFDELYSSPKYPLVRLGELAELVQYGSSDRADASEEEGLPMLRMVNLRNDTLDTTDLKYVNLSTRERERYALRPGDLLFNRTNSKELVGKCAVFDLSGDWCFASYLIRLRLTPSKVRPAFVAAFLATDIGRVQIDMISRQIIGMANINATELRDIKVPLPPVHVQDALLERLLPAQRESLKLRESASTVVSEAGKHLQARLDVEVAETALPRSFVLPLATIWRMDRLDAPSYQGLAGQRLGRGGTASLGQVADINPRDGRQTESTSEVGYVGLPNCDEWRIVTVHDKPFDEVRSRPVAKADDTLFARIEPSIFNKKYIYVDRDVVGDRTVYTSAEFYVLRAKPDRLDPAFLWAVLFVDYVYRQVIGMTTGSSGRRRLTRAALAAVRIPVPDLDEQRRLGAEMLQRRTDAKKALTDSIRIWSDAKRELESAVLSRESQ